MFQKVPIVVLVCGMLVQVLNLREPYLYGEMEKTGHVIASFFQGLMFLVYPLLGHFADVCLNRFRIIKWSFVPLFCGQATAVLSILAFVVFCGFTGCSSIVLHPPKAWLIILPVLGVLTSIVGTGLFEANIIQFGLDQLLEAPTNKLIAFIHWYYFGLTAGKLFSFYLYAGYSILKFYIHVVPVFLLTNLFPTRVLAAMIFASNIVPVLVSKELGLRLTMLLVDAAL